MALKRLDNGFCISPNQRQELIFLRVVAHRPSGVNKQNSLSRAKYFRLRLHQVSAQFEKCFA